MIFQTTIRIIARAEAADHPEEYVPLIRAWMEKLYPADFNWYFELRDKENDELRYFTLAPGDNGFDSTDNWSDEMIARYIADNIAFYHMKEDK